MLSLYRKSLSGNEKHPLLFSSPIAVLGQEEEENKQLERNDKIHWYNFESYAPDIVFVIFAHLRWDEVYGFDMSCMRKVALAEPMVDTVDCNQVSVSQPWFFFGHC